MRQDAAEADVLGAAPSPGVERGERMREHKPSVDPMKNAYLLGIAARLKVSPDRVECNVRVGPGGGLLLDVRLDGRDLRGDEERLVTEYLQEAFHGIMPRVEG